VSITITIVLALAANTSFGGLPILGSLLARDNFLPHLFGLRGDRQVFNAGIWVLAILSAALLVAVGGNTNELIPMFAIGVFTGFTLSQSGLVVHWWRERPARWRYRAMVNGTGALVTGTATVIFLVTKFVGGAWIVVVAVPAFIFLFVRIHAYYARVSAAIGIGEIPKAPMYKRTVVVVPIVNVSELTRFAIGEALSLSHDVVAISVVLEEGDEEHQRCNSLALEWQRWNPGPELQILHTEYTSVVTPISDFIDQERSKHHQQIVVLIPVLAPGKLRYRILHNQLDLVLSTELRKRTDIVVARVQMPMPTRPPRRMRKPPPPRSH
jgi:hypothetical protein